MLKTREEVQSEALKALQLYDYIGTIILGTGTGKTKVAIDAIKQGGFKNILITSPRTNLKENWRRELEKWGLHSNELVFLPEGSRRDPDCYRFVMDKHSSTFCFITTENIQTCYKWNVNELKKFDLIIFDEIHTMLTPEYSYPLRVAELFDIARIGLTATPDSYKNHKYNMYEDLCPIRYTYLEGAKDKIINDRFYFVYKYDLSNGIKTLVSTKKGTFEQGELDRSNYLNNTFDTLTNDILAYGVSNAFAASKTWAIDGMGNSTQKTLGFNYFRIMRQRKEFLNTLWSSRYITNQISSFILNHNKDNKILVFSELTAQLDLMGSNTVHSHKKSISNKELLEKFDSGEERILLSAQCLTLGLNLVNANHAILESYTGSKTQANQRLGRSDRLDVNKDAIIIILVPNNTQKTKWYEQAFADKIKEENSIQVSGLEEFFTQYKEYVNRRS